LERWLALLQALQALEWALLELRWQVLLLAWPVPQALRGQELQAPRQVEWQLCS
jgi:hypothetical protein